MTELKSQKRHLSMTTVNVLYLEISEERLVGVDIVLSSCQIDSHVRTLLDHCFADLRVPAAYLYRTHTHRRHPSTETMFSKYETVNVNGI